MKWAVNDLSSAYTPIPIINRMTQILDIVLDSPNGVRASRLLHSQSIPKTRLYWLLSSMTENELLTYTPEPPEKS